VIGKELGIWKIAWATMPDKLFPEPNIIGHDFAEECK
jgi:hypothetical protein